METESLSFWNTVKKCVISTSTSVIWYSSLESLVRDIFESIRSRFRAATNFIFIGFSLSSSDSILICIEEEGRKKGRGGG